MIPRLLIGLGFALVLGAASGAPIYRCGNTYSQVPCPEGGKIVEATDPRSAAQRAEARRLAAAERQAAAERERERKEKEAANAAATSAPGSLSPAPAASAASAARGGPHPPKVKKTATGKDFVAAVPRDKGGK